MPIENAVVYLSKLDEQVAKSSLERLFNSGKDKEKRSQTQIKTNVEFVNMNKNVKIWFSDLICVIEMVIWLSRLIPADILDPFCEVRL